MEERKRIEEEQRRAEEEERKRIEEEERKAEEEARRKEEEKQRKKDKEKVHTLAIYLPLSEDRAADWYVRVGCRQSGRWQRRRGDY
jgi:hypothetical protein